MTRWVRGRDGRLIEVTHEFLLATGEIRPLPDDRTPPKGTVFGSIVIPPREIPS